MEEIWKDCWEDTNYAVSNLGRARNNKTGEILKGGLDSVGHKVIWLRGNKQRTIHKLVFEAFYRKVIKGEVVHHLDENKLNNVSTNLVAWSNARHSWFHHQNGLNQSQQSKQRRYQNQKGKKMSDEAKAKRKQTRRLKRLADPNYGKRPEHLNLSVQEKERRKKSAQRRKDPLTGRFIKQ